MFMNKLIDYLKLEDEDEGTLIWEQELADNKRLSSESYNEGNFVSPLLLFRKKVQ